MLATDIDGQALQVALDGKTLPSLPLVVQRLLTAVNAPNTEARELASLIEQDAGLAARVLRLANSPFYGLSGEVGSIHQAVVILGFHAISQLAASVGLMQTIKVDNCAHFDIHTFWASSMRVALGARWLAKRVNLNAEHAYLSGLLHDIGLPVAVACFPTAMEEVLIKSRQTETDLLALENDALGFDHLHLGVTLAKNWHVPADIVRAMSSYRGPLLNTTAILEDTLYASWHLVQLKSQPAVAPLPTMNQQVAVRLRLDADCLIQFSAELDRCTPEIEALICAVKN